MRRLWHAVAGFLSPRVPVLAGSTDATGSYRQRESGRPPSANGASSLHLFWNLPHRDPLMEVSAVLEVVIPPIVPDLYFWALQVDFVSHGRSVGGGHTGLQWNRDFAGSTAVNWGGYASPASGGGELRGSVSPLPGIPGRENTRWYPWLPGRPYRLRVFPSPAAADAWRAEITDLSSNETSPIRDLYGGGDSLAAPMVWTEAFADCAAPSVAVRWSHLEAVDAAGRVVRPHSLVANYQSWEDGGCTNTTVQADGRAVLQVTGTSRDVAQGGLLAL